MGSSKVHDDGPSRFCTRCYMRIYRERREFHSFEVDGNPASEASGTLVSISTSNSSGRYNVLFFSVSVITHH
ncbi:hypothetical protein HID58_067438 [Brassica napus]|uniref:FLZ-type domain-containing protein n=1 Tax=Brassica napus TaxID=3708 RepID=A0ABQ7ZIN2_BRANA|nr:hypothetical protein HID58_067438 [Brassica napus]